LMRKNSNKALRVRTALSAGADGVVTDIG
jgi:hypothetical protein